MNTAANDALIDEIGRELGTQDTALRRRDEMLSDCRYFVARLFLERGWALSSELRDEAQQIVERINQECGE